ncbi:MAG TPA: GNAT family N-acetyltransferase [Noviherbaspirillum sp.]|nr:GNAT family N-acetyltransferase [Noviherbaspirillum sp.]
MESMDFRADELSCAMCEAAAAESGTAPAPQAEELSITCLENQVPPYVASELARLYGHIFSSLAQLRAYGELDAHTSTYIVRRGRKIVTLLLYRRDGSVVRVLNQSIPVGGEDMQRFAATMFSTYRSVRRIAFHAVQADATGPGFPHQRYNCADDIVIDLPATQQAYLASLGKNTRRNIRRYMERLQRAYPSFHIDFRECADAGEDQVRTIIGFNHARMAGKNKTSSLDALEAQRIVQLTRECGLLGVASIDGRPCAGGIAYRVGDNFFLYVIAHDPAYDDYWVGILTCYLMIGECIARGGKAFHFLWGRYDYKFSLGAVLRTLDHVDLYRSRASYLRNSPAIAQTALRREAFQLKFALLDMARRKDSTAARFVSRQVERLRRAKRQADGLLQARSRSGR